MFPTKNLSPLFHVDTSHVIVVQLLHTVHIVLCLMTTKLIIVLENPLKCCKSQPSSRQMLYFVFVVFVSQKTVVMSIQAIDINSNGLGAWLPPVWLVGRVGRGQKISYSDIVLHIPVFSDCSVAHIAPNQIFSCCCSVS